MTRPKLLDLFCGAGGCSVGYHRAGFDVTGVDIELHSDYPYELIVRNVLDMATTDFGGFDVIHASPPCQAYTTMSNRRRRDWPDLIAPVRDMLRGWGGTYVIENVPGARTLMVDPVVLHGGMFGLGVHRPRLFESNALLMVTRAAPADDPVGVYGKLDGRRLWTRSDGTEMRAPLNLTTAATAMGIDWMEWDDLREAIPPAYTEYLGRQLIDQVMFV